MNPPAKNFGMGPSQRLERRTTWYVIVFLLVLGTQLNAAEGDDTPLSEPATGSEVKSQDGTSASSQDDDSPTEKKSTPEKKRNTDIGDNTAQTAAPPAITPPELTNFVEAIYPSSAQVDKIEGDVILALTVNADGTVADPEVIQSLRADLDEAALLAVKKFTFKGGKVNGRAVPLRIQYRYTFVLTKETVEVLPTNAPKGDFGQLGGQIFERGTRRPLVGMEIKIEGLESEFTDGNGKFLFSQVPAGQTKLIVMDDEYETVESKDEVRKGEVTELTLYLPRKGFDTGITVRAKRIKKEVVRRTVTVEEIRLIPGTNGDALGVVQNLPGAARSSFGNTELILRGGGQTQVYLNQQAIPLAFHFGGIRSTVASGLIEDIDIYPSNFGVEFGRINGGVVDVQLRRPKTDRIHGVVEADVFDAAALVEGPVGENGAFALAVRRSYFDVLFGALIPQNSGITIETLPRYYDSQAIYDWRKGKHQLNLTVYGSSDRFEAVFEEPPEQNARVRGEAVFALEWLGAQSRWKTRIAEGLKHELSIAWLQTNVDVRFGTIVDLDFQFRQWLIRDNLTYDATKDLKLRLGTDIDLTESDIYAYGSGGPPKEGTPNTRANTEEAIETESQTIAKAIGIYTDVTYQLGQTKLIPGLRYDYISQTGEHFIQPRFVARSSITKNSTVKAGYGYYIQPPQDDELVIGSGPKPKSELSTHYALGLEHAFNELVDIDVSLFYKDFDKLVRRQESQEIVFNNDGIGRAYGLEVLLRHKMSSRFFGWLAYTLQRSERKDDPSGPWRPFDSDQTHNLILIGQYKLTPKWSVGLRWRFVTGNPETPVVGAIYEADDNVYVPVFGEVNSSRQPNFTQLDLRIDRVWTFDTWKLTGYLDIRNVLNEANGSDRIYSYDYSEEARSTEIPIVPSFGLRGTF